MTPHYTQRMKRLFVVAALAALCAAVSGVSASAAPAVACNAPPASYRSSPAKIGAWAGACIVCKRVGPRKLGQQAHLGTSDPRAVARKYAERYANLAQAQPIVRAIGGKAAARTIIRAGCLAGFQARGRP